MYGIIILNWNGSGDTIQCLKSVLKLKEPNAKIIIVDNGSSDNSVANIEQYLRTEEESQEDIIPNITRHKLSGGKDIFFIRNSSNDGYAGGNNIGIKFLLSFPEIEYIWVLNNDTIVDSCALISLVEKIKSDPQLGAVGSCVLFLEAPEKIWAACGGIYSKLTCGSKNIDLNLDLIKQEKSEIEVEELMDYIAGASILFSRKALEDVGLFCEDYFLYFEEPDWCNRAKKGGYKLGYASKSVVYHGVGKSTDKYNKTLRRFYSFRWLQLKNRIKFSAKFHPYSLPIVFGYIFAAELVAASRFAFKKFTKTVG
jgi:GT2 family glycosyltransferase